MAKIKKAEETTFAELNMTPMIDVIFQLMIFFMCSIHFKSLEGKLYSYLPRDKGMSSTTVTDPILEEVRIKLAYSESADLLTKIKVGEREFKTWDALYEHMKSIAPTLITPSLDIIPVKIDADEMIPVQSVVHALNICKKAGVQKTEFAAKTGGAPKKK